MLLSTCSRAWRATLTCALGAAAAVLACASAGAQPTLPARPALPPAADFFRYATMSAPVLSPEGQYLAVLWRGAVGERSALAVMDVKGTGRPRVLARFQDTDIVGVRWVGEQQLVFQVTDLQTGSGARQVGRGLFTVPREGGAVRTLIRSRADNTVRERQTEHSNALGFQHRLLTVPQDGSDEVIIGRPTQLPGGALDTLWPLRLHVLTGRVRELGGPALPPGQQWWFDTLGRPRAAQAGRDNQTRVWWLPAGAEAWQLLATHNTQARPWGPAAVDNDGRLYVIHADATRPGELQVLSRFDAEQRRPESEPLIRVQGFDFNGQLLFDRADGRYLGVRTEAETEFTAWADPRLKAKQAEVDALMPGRVNRLQCRRCGRDDAVYVITSYSDQEPGLHFVWLPGAAKPRLLGAVNEAIDPAQAATLDFHRIKARDGRDVPVWLTEPSAPAAGGKASRPAVVLVHGGPWVRGNTWGWDPMTQFLASRGYVVIEPEFRGSTGYGASHHTAGFRQWGRAMQDDVADALQWAVRQQLVDPKRVCIAGASYGGYATLMGLVRHPELYRCGVAWVAVTDLPRLVEGGSGWWVDDVSEEGRRYTIPLRVGDATQDREMLLAHSPLHQADRIQAPLLLAFGAEDQRVPLIHGRDLRDALVKQGRPPEWIVYPDEGHGWRRLSNQIDFAQRVEAFLATHTAPAAR